MTDKPDLVEVINEAVWQLGIAAGATGNAAFLAAAEKLSAAHRSRVPVAWGCWECEWIRTASDFARYQSCGGTSIQEWHDRQAPDLECRAAVRPLVEGE